MIPEHEYIMHRVEYRHCIAFAKGVELIVNKIFDEDFQKEHNIMCDEFGHFVFENEEGTGVQDISVFTYQENRAGCYGALDTHHISFYTNALVLELDDAEHQNINVSDLDLSEERFFQNSLIMNGHHLFYTVVYAYFKENIKYQFALGSSVQKIYSNFPDVFDELKSTEYYQDLLDLLHMPLERINKEDHDICPHYLFQN